MTAPARDDGQAKGFAALDALVSDVSLEVAQAAGVPKEPKTTSPPQPDPPEVESSPSSSPAWPLANITLLLSMLGVVAVGLAISYFSTRNGAPSMPAVAPEPANAATPSSKSAGAATPDEQMPPKGQGLLLNEAQVRWCRREGIQVSAVESILDARSKKDVEVFNRWSANYDQRCSDFRYRPGDLERVDSQLAAGRDGLVKETESLWLRGSQTRNQAHADVSAAKPANEVDAPPADRRPTRTRIPADATPAEAKPTPSSRSRTAGMDTQDSFEAASTAMTVGTCRQGFQPVGGGACRADAPTGNSSRNWDCQWGFELTERGCAVIQVPANAEMKPSGRDWECSRGFEFTQKGCIAIQVPPNAQMIRLGRGWNWECKPGFRLTEQGCMP